MMSQPNDAAAFGLDHQRRQIGGGLGMGAQPYGNQILDPELNYQQYYQ